MIIEYYPGPVVEKPKYTPPPAMGGALVLEKTYHPSYYEHCAKKKGVSIEEFKRRDEIIRKQFMKAAYTVGDMVYPYNKKGYDEYGMCKIKGIYHNYAAFEGEWPDENGPQKDVPFIVTAYPILKTQQVFFATAGYFVNQLNQIKD